jgi:hypothetical protein
MRITGERRLWGCAREIPGMLGRQKGPTQRQGTVGKRSEEGVGRGTSGRAGCGPPQDTLRAGIGEGHIGGGSLGGNPLTGGRGEREGRWKVPARHKTSSIAADHANMLASTEASIQASIQAKPEANTMRDAICQYAAAP